MSGLHTPGTALPWHLGNGDIYAEGTKSSDFDDIVICAIGQAGGFRSHEYALARAHKPDGKANAAYIVHACNNFPALLEALQAIVTPTGFANLDAGGIGSHGKALAAIASATGAA